LLLAVLPFLIHGVPRTATRSFGTHMDSQIDDPQRQIEEFQKLLAQVPS
jgi:hypothetical protein